MRETEQPPHEAAARAALTNHMALLEAMFDKAPVGLGVVDRNFRYLMVNPVLAAINGLTPDAHIGRTPRDIVPDIWPSIEIAYQRAMHGETVANQMMSGIIPSGVGGKEVRHWLTGYYPVRHNDEIIGIGIVVNDVTEVERYREALRIRTDLYAMISRTSRAAIERQSADALFQDVCRIAVETGQFRLAWIGVPDGDRIRSVTSAGDDDGYLASLVITTDPTDPRSHGPTGRAVRTGTYAIANDFAADASTAPWHDLAVQAGFGASAAFPLHERGKVAASLTLYADTAGFFTPDLVATLSEITPIVSFALDALASEAEKQRDDEELRMRDRVIRAVSSGICIADARLPDNPMIFVSPGFEKLTGYQADEMLGRNCRLLQGTDTDPVHVATIRAAIHAGRGCTVEILNYRKDGSAFWNELTISPVHDESGALTHFVGVQADVTERRQLEQQIRQSQKMEAVGQLASGVAHDFNNLITVIDVCSDLLARGLAKQLDLLELAVEVQQAGERAGNLTRQLLTFSRRQVVSPRILDINTIVAESEKLLRRLIGEHIILVTDCDPSVAPVLADPGQVEQVLVNLAVNARDAMPTGGRLSIRTRGITIDAATGALQAGRHVLIEVQDTGTGMSAETCQQIFEPFFTTKSAGKGTGLGLATVRSIVEQARGDVSVDSTLGLGTTFRVYLPCTDDAADELASRPQGNGMPTGTETILLVEDDDAVRALGQLVLERCGYTVLPAADGKAALEFAQSYPDTIHLLLSDVVMPHLGGRMLAEAINRIRPDCKVMFVSGYTDDEVLLHGVVHSEVTMLQKPYSLVTLAQTVRRVIDG